jgi:hypothetical protein
MPELSRSVSPPNGDLMQFKRWAVRHGERLSDVKENMNMIEDSDSEKELLMDDEEEENNSEVIEWLKAWERKEKLEQRIRQLARK